MEVNNHKLAFFVVLSWVWCYPNCLYHMIQLGVCDEAWTLMQKHLHANKFEHSGRTHVEPISQSYPLSSLMITLEITLYKDIWDHPVLSDQYVQK